MATTPETPDVIPELAELRTPPKAFSVPAPKELTGLSTGMGAGVPGVPEDYAAARAKFKKPTDVSTEQAKMLQQQGRLEQDIGMATQAKEQYIAEAKADIATQERQAAQNIEANLEATRKKFPYPEFHPTKDNIESLSTLFGLIGVIGASLGGAGKMSATTSLNAMGGMMKGWQQGRSDLWKKEKEEFDKGMQQTKAILEDAYKDADRAMKTLAYNRQEAEALANQSAAKLGGQVGKQILAKQGVERYFTFLDGVKKDLTEAEKRAFEKSKFAAEQERAKRQFELQERRLDLQEERARIAAETKTGKPPPEKVTAQNQLRNNLIPKIEKALPIIDRLEKEGKWSDLSALLAIDPRLAEYQFRNDKGALDVILALAYFRSKEFETAGKALTRVEDKILSPLVRGDLRVYEGIKNAMEDGLQTLKNEQRAIESTYPAIKTFNQSLRGDVSQPAASFTEDDMQNERGRAYTAIDNGADINAVKKRFKEKTGEDL
jgi:ribosomal protein L9